MKYTGWQTTELNGFEKYDHIKRRVEEVKNTQPSREFVQDQIDNIFVIKGNGIVQYDRIIMALQALLELVEASGSNKSESDL